jgi:hypothetical protein
MRQYTPRKYFMTQYRPAKPPPDEESHESQNKKSHLEDEPVERVDPALHELLQEVSELRLPLTAVLNQVHLHWLRVDSEPVDVHGRFQVGDVGFHLKADGRNEGFLHPSMIEQD